VPLCSRVGFLELKLEDIYVIIGDCHHLDGLVEDLMTFLDGAIVQRLQKVYSLRPKVLILEPYRIQILSQNTYILNSQCTFVLS